MQCNKPEARIIQWYIVDLGISPYRAPEVNKMQLAGVVEGHPYHEDGRHIITSVIEKFNRHSVETINTIYHLGDPDESFEAFMQDKHPGWDKTDPFAYLFDGEKENGN